MHLLYTCTHHSYTRACTLYSPRLYNEGIDDNLITIQREQLSTFPIFGTWPYFILSRMRSVIEYDGKGEPEHVSEGESEYDGEGSLNMIGRGSWSTMGRWMLCMLWGVWLSVMESSFHGHTPFTHVHITYTHVHAPYRPRAYTGGIDDNLIMKQRGQLNSHLSHLWYLTSFHIE